MTTINIRVDEQLKKDSESIFKELGLGITSAMTIFLKAVVRTRSIPFPLEIPNEETLEALDEMEKDRKGIEKMDTYNSVEELKKELDL